jgi:hypothetical protein
MHAEHIWAYICSSLYHQAPWKKTVNHPCVPGVNSSNSNYLRRSPVFGEEVNDLEIEMPLKYHRMHPLF